jgi:protein gp37
MALAKRLDMMGHKVYAGTWNETKTGKVIWSGKINASNFDKPTKIKEPSIIFVNSMSDFFHEGASDELKIRALKVMADTERHQYQVLTKRPELIEPFLDRAKIDRFPDNVWIGATVESKLVKSRIDVIRRIPSKIKFLSIEPLISELGPIDLSGIDWIITGGESGPNARSMEANWLWDVHVETRRQGVRHFFKQYGKPQNNPLYEEAIKAGKDPIGYVNRLDPVGKGGSLIRGEYVKEMPENFKVAEYF